MKKFLAWLKQLLRDIYLEPVKPPADPPPDAPPGPGPVVPPSPPGPGGPEPPAPGGADGDYPDEFTAWDQVRWLHADIHLWPRTSQLLQLDIDRPGNKIWLRHTKGGKWPETVGSNGKHTEGNVWILAQYRGEWWAWTWEWLGVDQRMKGVTVQEIGRYSKKEPIYSGYTPAKGDVVYFAVSTHARNLQRTTNERTQFRRVVWP
jgi:hypothetical protein